MRTNKLIAVVLIVIALLLGGIFILLATNTLSSTTTSSSGSDQSIAVKPGTETPEKPKEEKQKEDTTITSHASPDTKGLKLTELEQYLDAYANYRYQYKVDNNHIQSFNVERYSGCSATNGQGAIYDVSYTNRRGNSRQEYYFIGIHYTTDADGTIRIIDTDDEDDSDLNDIYKEAREEGFTCE